MTRLNGLLNDFGKLLKDQQAPIFDKLQVGLDFDEIDSLLKPEGINNAELRLLYKWRNGIKDLQNYTIDELELFPEGIMLSLSGSLSHYEIYTQVEKIWDKSLFPIFTNGGGDYFLLDIESESKTEGMVFLYAPSLLLSDSPVTIYDSIENLIDTVLECFKHHAYKLSNEKNIVIVDYDLRQKISKNKNPESIYWKLQ